MNEAAAVSSAESGAPPHALESFKPAERFARREPEPLSPKEAAESVAGRRRLKDGDEMFEAADAAAREDSPIHSDDTESYTESDLRKVAAELSEFRSRRDDILAELVETPNDAKPKVKPTAEQGATRSQAEAIEHAARAQVAEATRISAARTDYERAAAQAASQSQQAMTLAMLQTQQVIAGEFPDVKTQADVERLAQTNPARFNRLAQLATHFDQAKVTAQQLQARQAEHSQHEFKRFAEREDQVFTEDHPELKDEGTRRRVYRDSVDFLKHIGVDENRMRELWNKEPLFRSAEAQKLLYYATKNFVAERGLKVARTENRKPLPPVQRPGVAQRGDRGETEIRELGKRLDQHPTNIRLAAKLVAAQRRARG
jgi:hypothetical protein